MFLKFWDVFWVGVCEFLKIIDGIYVSLFWKSVKVFVSIVFIILILVMMMISKSILLLIVFNVYLNVILKCIKGKYNGYVVFCIWVVLDVKGVDF